MGFEPDVDDAALVRAVADGDEAALQVLLRRHVPWLKARLARRCDDPEAGHIHDRFGLRPGLTAAQAGDVLWSLTAPELADRLVNRRQWGWDRFQSWLGATMTDALAKR